MSDAPVIIGYDGSPAAEHAMRRAAALVAPRRALVVVVWEAGAAYETLERPATIPAAPLDLRTALEADQAMYDGARALAERGAALATELGLDAESLVVADEVTVAQTLVRLADEQRAGAIVVGAHGHRRLQDLFVGSTSRQVLEHADCPVIVVGPHR